MNIHDFIYKTEQMNYLEYKERDITYVIVIKDGMNDTYEIFITAEERGRHIHKKANQILAFLKSHLYEHARFRLEAVTKGKKELSIHNKVSMKEYQYYTLEVLQLFCIIGLLIPVMFFNQTWAFFIHVPLQSALIFYTVRIKKPDGIHFMITEDFEKEIEIIRKRNKRKLVLTHMNMGLTVFTVLTYLVQKLFF